MITYRKLTHDDYDDIVDLCKDIWDGTDYLPELFHSWVDDKGLFLGAVDSETNKVVGVDKYSVLHDGTGWLEGLRTHKDYRGKGIGKKLAIKTLEYAKLELRNGLIKKLAFSTHITAVESISLMKKLGFELEQQYIFVQKDYKQARKDISAADFDVLTYRPSYEDFLRLPYITKRSGILPFVFYFQKPTEELYEELINDNCFVSINGYKGLYKLKGEPHFIVWDESIDGINTFMDYYLLLLNGKCPSPPLTSVAAQDLSLIESLKAAGYSAIADWSCDYLYFTYAGE